MAGIGVGLMSAPSRFWMHVHIGLLMPAHRGGASHQVTGVGTSPASAAHDAARQAFDLMRLLEAPMLQRPRSRTL